MKVAAAATIISLPMALALTLVPIRNRLVLLDRDGVINEDVGSPGVLRRSQFVLTPDAGRAIGLLKRHGCKVAVITNQSCVGKGLLSKAELNDIHIEMQQMLLQQDSDAFIDNIYFCTSAEDSPRKKPNPGMIHEACQDFGVDPTIDCVFIGDTLTDMQAARAGGIEERFLVQTGYGLGLMGFLQTSNPPQLIEKHHKCIRMKEELRSIAPFYYAANMAAAVHLCLSQSK